MRTGAHEEPVVVVAPRRGVRGVLGAGIVAALLVGLGWMLAGGLPDLNPFATKTVDRSPPPVLRSIERLNEFHAATARLQQVVDVERDAKLLPSFISGSKTVFMATGSVDAVVDFSRLDRRNVVVSQDGRRATITLPAPRLAKPRIDMEHSRVVARDRGLVQRVGSVFQENPTSERGMILRAQAKLATAAAADRRVISTAQANTRRMLTQLLGSLGVRQVTVRFRAPAV